MQPATRATNSTAWAIDLGLAQGWGVVLFNGILTVVLAIVVLVWPGETLRVLTFLVGIQLVIFGIIRLATAFSSQALAPAIAGIVGVLAMIVGIIVLRNPFETIAVLATLLGVVWIVTGAVDLFTTIQDAAVPNRVLQALSAIVSIVAGIVIVAWPTPSITVIAWISGIYLLVMGAIIVVTALGLRSLAKEGAAA